MASVDRKTVLQTGVVTSSVRDRTAPRSWLCRVTEPNGQDRQFSLGSRAIVIGADRRCDFVLTDPQVSRRHAELQATPEGVRIRDLSSTNGTFWQGSRVVEISVPSGANVRFGNTQARFATHEVPTLPPSERQRFGALVGVSVAMRELFAVLELASPTDATVLIQGESGTGKELAARAIHDHSARARGPFVVFDCSAVTESLIDSHLFGHVKGAFTGANTERGGAFVEASGGTLFLDELGELALTSQTKLLRALEAQTVQPVGSDQRVSVDTRVVAATHRDLAAMVEAEEFRFDLFYRLAVVHAHIPPLRDRPDDIRALVEHFYEGRGVEPGDIAGDNLTRLCRHAWPGNVRELRNVLERAWALSGPAGAGFSGLRLWVTPTPPNRNAEVPIDTTMPFKEAKERWVELFERRYVAKVFSDKDGNITHAAEQAGINRRHFRTLLRKHGIIDG